MKHLPQLPAQLSGCSQLIALLMAPLIMCTAVLAQNVPTEPNTQSVLVDKTDKAAPADDTASPAPEIELGNVNSDAPGQFVFRPSSFQGVIPGASPEAEITKQLGAPRAKIETNGGMVFVYAIEPYDRVGIVMRGGVADSIHLHFKKPAELNQVAAELGLKQQTAVTQTTRSGQDFLLTWPDQGISLHFRRQGTLNTVTRVSFTTAQPDPYLLRGLNRQWTDYAGALHDARAVQSLDPLREEGFILEAQIARRMGNLDIAKKALAQALELTTATIDLLLLQVELSNDPAESNRLLPSIRAIRNNVQLPVLTRAKAAFAMGQIHIQATQPDYKQAMVFHSEAIQRARIALENKDLATQFAALRLLIEGHLAVAQDINRGDYSVEEKNRVVPKWINISWKLAAHLSANQYHDQTYGLEVCRRSLAIVSQLSEAVAIDVWEDRINQSTTEVLNIQDASVEFTDHVRWQRAMALYYATLIARQGKDANRVQQLGLVAYQLFQEPLSAERRSPHWDLSTTHAAMVGLCYTMGSVEAVDNLDHEKAVAWYDQAVKHLNTPDIQKHATSLGWHGERMVSMGLSYWKAGNRTQGLNLTKGGISWIEKAVQHHNFPKQNLRIPYSNLSVMYRSMGQNQNAERIADAVDNLSKQR